MRILVAGASGALGIPAVRTLRERGHEVFGTTRAIERAPAIEEAGARAIIADAMDAASIAAAVRYAQPEVVVDALTALPKGGPLRPSDMRRTNETRIRASGHLLRAAIEARVRRYVAESFFLVYGSGDLGSRPLTEDQRVPIQLAHRPVRPIIEAILTKETRALDASRAGGIEGLVLRFGAFYGRGAGLENLLSLLRRRLLPVVESRNATPYVHIDDAGAAVAAAAETGRPGGVYNVVDDQALPMARFLRSVARIGGAPPPLVVPAFVLWAIAPYLKALLVDSNIPLSNARAKAELGWVPSYPTVEAGLTASFGRRAAALSARGTDRVSAPGSEDP